MQEPRNEAMDKLLSALEQDGEGVGRLDTSIQRVWRMRNDRDGNPRWRLVTEHGEFVTPKNSQVGLSINPDWRDVSAQLLIREGEVVGVKVPEL
jgi:hypothetical protein